MSKRAEEVTTKPHTHRGQAKRLPARGFHDFGQRRAFGALHQGDYFGLLVGAVSFGLALWLLGRALFAALAFLAFVCAFSFARSGADLLMFSLSIAFSLIGLSLQRLAVVTWITPVGRNIK
jgi:hypothetical protein